MKSKLLLIAIPIGIIAYFSCRRAPDVSFEQNFEQRFFTVPGNTHPLVKALVEKIKQQNQRFGFVNDLVKRAGFPFWNKSAITNSQQNNISVRTTAHSDTNMVLIPFVKQNSGYVNSILGIRMTKTDTSYKILYAEEYANYGFSEVADTVWNAQDIFSLFILFDKTVFGYNKWHIIDERLVNPHYQNSQDSTKGWTVNLGNLNCENCSIWIPIPQEYCIPTYWVMGIKINRLAAEIVNQDVLIMYIQRWIALQFLLMYKYLVEAVGAMAAEVAEAVVVEVTRKHLGGKNHVKKIRIKLGDLHRVME